MQRREFLQLVPIVTTSTLLDLKLGIKSKIEEECVWCLPMCLYDNNPKLSSYLPIVKNNDSCLSCGR